MSQGMTSSTSAGDGKVAGAARDPYGNGKQYNPMINGQEVVGVRYDPVTKNGIVSYKLADGRVLDKEDAMSFISNGDARGLVVQTNAYGLYIKTPPDGDFGNNLENMPTFE